MFIIKGFGHEFAHPDVRSSGNFEAAPTGADYGRAGSTDDCDKTLKLGIYPKSRVDYLGLGFDRCSIMHYKLSQFEWYGTQVLRLYIITCFLIIHCQIFYSAIYKTIQYTIPTCISDAYCSVP